MWSQLTTNNCIKQDLLKRTSKNIQQKCQWLNNYNMENVADLGVWSVSGTRSLGFKKKIKAKLIKNKSMSPHSFVIFTWTWNDNH